MPGKDIVIVFDCGATNIRVMAVNSTGDILSGESLPNNPVADPLYRGYRIWDVNDIWAKMCSASRKVMQSVNRQDITGVTVTTFGVDGTLFDRNGRMLYPVISWQCERTVKVMSDLAKYIPVEELYSENGVFPFHFNTISKLIWFLEQKPGLIEKSTVFLFMPSIFSFFLSGEMVNDITMAGTSMLTRLKSRDYSGNIFDKIGFPKEKIGRVVEPGTITGTVTGKASAETSLPEGTPVVATGHDTQFAIFGSGAMINQPVLSSGTWEILMVRAEGFRTGKQQLNQGITTEFDVIPGLYNIGSQWLASGIIEWARRNFFSDYAENVYEAMISGAEEVPAGSRGVKVVPGFCEEWAGGSGGQISGLSMESTRYDIFRAILEALARRLAEGRQALEKAGGFRTESIICVGGGSRNRLWNRLRADFTGVPVIITGQKETTVLGASFFVQAACGNYPSPEEARKAVDFKTEIIEPA
jgi:L-fuculokinase